MTLQQKYKPQEFTAETTQSTVQKPPRQQQEVTRCATENQEMGIFWMANKPQNILEIFTMFKKQNKKNFICWKFRQKRYAQINGSGADLNPTHMSKQCTLLPTSQCLYSLKIWEKPKGLVPMSGKLAFWARGLENLANFALTVKNHLQGRVFEGKGESRRWMMQQPPVCLVGLLPSPCTCRNTWEATMISWCFEPTQPHGLKQG